MPEKDGRLTTGIFGLDQIIEGGFRDKSSIVCVGSSGTGKTTFGMQFLMHGIEKGEQGLYVTMEESPEQIMREAEWMGWDMKKHFEKSLFFIHLKGKNFKKMIDEFYEHHGWDENGVPTPETLTRLVFAVPFPLDNLDSATCGSAYPFMFN